MEDNRNITNYQLFSSIVVTIVGVGIFSYPSSITAAVKTDGWIVTIAAGLLSFLFTYMIYKIIEMNDYNKFYDILVNNLGKFFGSIIALFFSYYCILYMSIGMRIFAEVLKIFLFDKTHTEVLIIVMILAGIYVVNAGLNNLVKFNELTFFIMFFGLSIIYILMLNNIHLSNILPILHNRPIKLLMTLPKTVFSFAGFEIVYLVLPYIKDRKNISKTIFYSILVVTIFFSVTVILCLATFNVKQTEKLIWPTLSMIKSIYIKDSFIEQWEGIAMIFWILFYVTTFVNYYYFSADIVKSIFNIKDIKVSSFIVMPFIYITSLYLDNIVEVYKFENTVVNYIGYFAVIFLTIILFTMGYTKREIISKRGKKHEVRK